ncbi:OX-2 membrane glycoprotein-like isoform 2-T2 [Mantella aurantiaca]
MKLLIVLLEVAAAFASAPRVICTKSSPAVLGADVTLTCEFHSHLEVLQVTWQKRKGRDTQNMVTYSETYGSNIAKPFEKHITVLNASSTISSIRISRLEKEDEACYNCLFNVYPNGAYTGEVHLNDLERQSKPAEDADVFFTQCSASGTKEFIITWQDGGQPVSQENKENTTGNVRTVTSTRKYTASSLPAHHSCSIKYKAEPEKVVLDVKDLNPGSVNTDDPKINEAWQQDFGFKSLMKILSGALVLVILILLLIFYKPWKKTETKTPKKLCKAENGHITPKSSIRNNLMPAVSDSPKFFIENDSEKEIPSSPMNEGTPRSSNRRNPMETKGSSVKKRNLCKTPKNSFAARKLDL